MGKLQALAGRMVWTAAVAALVCGCKQREREQARHEPAASVVRPEIEIPERVEPVEPPPPATPQPCEDTFPLADRHLGDGTITDNYYFIADELVRSPGSAKHTREIEDAERRAAESWGTAQLKPPSSNVVETEFSHLLGAVMTSNGGIGAAVFDTHGLKIGADGAQLDSIVLSDARRRAVARLGRSSPPLVERFTCERLAQIASHCGGSPTRDIPCWEAKQLAGDCKLPIIAQYKPVLDPGDSDKVLGISMIIAPEPAHCPPPR